MKNKYINIYNMKQYIKDNKILPLEKIVIIQDGMQTFNPTEEMLFENGWEIYKPIEVELTEEQKLKYKKEQILLDIECYDNSESVNQCVIKQGENEFGYWANKSERSTLKTAIQDCITMGIETYRLDLRELGVSITIPCQNMIQMLAALEVYAIKCYNKTTDHIFNINKIENMEDLDNYDYTSGYPEKLVFNI
jgi:hypothetical protein